MNKPVNFELAKLLKGKGFNIPCKLYYKKDKNLYEGSIKWINSMSPEMISAPTIAEVVMWLYEKHRIWIEINFLPNMSKFSFISKPIDFKKPKEFLSYKEYYDATAKFVSKEKFNSPTEAYEAAIKYSLTELIK